MESELLCLFVLVLNEYLIFFQPFPSLMRDKLRVVSFSEHQVTSAEIEKYAKMINVYFDNLLPKIVI
jgi:hypothetical protein